MTENLRNEFQKQIAEGDTSALVALTATMLASEVLPALDELRKQLAALKWKFNLTEQALAEIVTIYEHLQDFAPTPEKEGRLADDRRRLQAKLERVTERLMATKV
jgi:hypothetical protein